MDYLGYFRAGVVHWEEFIGSFYNREKVGSPRDSLTPDDLTRLFYEAEKKFLSVEYILMHPKNYQELHKDFSFSHSIISAPNRVTIWGVEVIILNKIPPGLVLAVSKTLNSCTLLELISERAPVSPTYPEINGSERNLNILSSITGKKVLRAIMKVSSYGRSLFMEYSDETYEEISLPFHVLTEAGMFRELADHFKNDTSEKKSEPRAPKDSAQSKKLTPFSSARRINF